MQQIDLPTLNLWQATGKDFLLVDVREPFEHEHFNIGGINIPLNELMRQIDYRYSNQTIVLYCAKGIRSLIAVQRLEEKGFHQAFNLSGGIANLYPMQ